MLLMLMWMLYRLMWMLLWSRLRGSAKLAVVSFPPALYQELTSSGLDFFKCKISNQFGLFGCFCRVYKDQKDTFCNMPMPYGL